MARPAMEDRAIRPEFTGSAQEYFRLWIVNLFFTLITLGIYSAWAKVRKKKYFYGNTRFDGDTFDYSARPEAILKGRIVAVAFFLAYAFVGELVPESRYVFWALAILLLPWFVVRALTFNARNSAYRGLRFGFSGSARDAARIYIGMLAVAVLTLGLAFPWFMARQKAFAISHHRYGTTTFGCDLSAAAYFGIYFRAGLMVIGMSIPVGIVAAFLAAPLMAGPARFAWVAVLLPLLGAYFGYAIAYAYVQARATNLAWAGTYGPGIRFASALSAVALIRLYLGNIVAIAGSAGLLIPWAVVRTVRYRLENFTMIVDENMVHEADPTLTRVGATGQELGDIFNIDLGI